MTVRWCLNACGRPAREGPREPLFCGDGCKAEYYRSRTAARPRTSPGASQNERVLSLLTARGPAGVTSLDFDLPRVKQLGLGDPILRLAARIHQLKARGHDIERVETKPVARYVLRALSPAYVARMVTTALVATEPEPPALFDEAPRGPMNPTLADVYDDAA